MKLKLLSLYCILQSIFYSEGTPRLIFPPDIHAKSSRIVGGTVAPNGIAPYQCSIQVGVKDQYYHTCGCAIIAELFVITAAHCVEGLDTYNTRILVGTNSLLSGGSYYTVETFLPHEKYNQPETANDIALIEMEYPIEFDEYVQPISLETNRVPCTKNLQLTGWGVVDPNDDHLSKLLQIMTLRSLAITRCNRYWNQDPPISRNQWCALPQKGQGACMGDSGGPLVYDNKLVGIVSFGMPCGVGYPDVFTKVSSYIKWIETTMSNTFLYD